MSEDRELINWRRFICQKCWDYIEHPLSIASDNPCKATDEDVKRCLYAEVYNDR